MVKRNILRKADEPLPNDVLIDEAGSFPSFKQSTTITAAIAIIRLCQQQGNWSPVTQILLSEFNLSELLQGHWVIPFDDKYAVTRELIDFFAIAVPA